MKKMTVLVPLVCFLSLFAATTSNAAELSKGQSVYVPATVLSLPSPGGGTQLFVTRVLIRNVDSNNPITLTSVAFYDSDGNLATLYLPGGPFSDFISGSESISPLSSDSFLVSPFITVPAGDPFPSWVTDAGGGRPFFIVKWEANGKVGAPYIEGATIVLNNGIYNGFGYRKGVVLEEK
jgi:hypothetical protein